jgi:hypothetical protein
VLKRTDNNKYPFFLGSEIAMISIKTNNFLDIIVHLIYYNYEQNITFVVKTINGTEKVHTLLKA